MVKPVDVRGKQVNTGNSRRYEGHWKNADTVQFRGAIGSLHICEVQILTRITRPKQSRIKNCTLHSREATVIARIGVS